MAPNEIYSERFSYSFLSSFSLFRPFILTSFSPFLPSFLVYPHPFFHLSFLWTLGVCMCQLRGRKARQGKQVNYTQDSSFFSRKKEELPWVGIRHSHDTQVCIIAIYLPWENQTSPLYVRTWTLTSSRFYVRLGSQYGALPRCAVPRHVLPRRWKWSLSSRRGNVAWRDEAMRHIPNLA